MRHEKKSTWLVNKTALASHTVVGPWFGSKRWIHVEERLVWALPEEGEGSDCTKGPLWG